MADIRPGQRALALQMEHVCKGFCSLNGEQLQLFNDFSLQVPTGQFISIVGGNGSGKTTLLNLLCGTILLDSGRILLGGVEITKLPEHQRAARLGRVFQDPARGTCASLTVLENMALAEHKGGKYGLQSGVNRKRLEHYRAQLSRLQLGLEDKVDWRVGSLSGGQRQALALLLATLTPIDLLLLDEHIAALDPRSSETVMLLTEQLVREQQLTALMVTHDLQDALRYGDRLLMLDHGSCLIDAAGLSKQELTVSALMQVFMRPRVSSAV